MLLLDLPGKLYTTNVVAIAFFYAPACSRFSQLRKVFKSIYFLARNNKNKKYENPLAPTDFVTEEAVWFWLDSLDSQTFRSGGIA